MAVRRLGHWLAVLAITLNAAWPLLANARPKSVHLVPLCTVEGITHYVEVPGGTTPLDKSADSHHEHCSFCFLGASALLPSDVDLPLVPLAASERIRSAADYSHPTASLLAHGARAPPSSVVIAVNHNFGGKDEGYFFAGRAARAAYS